MAIKDPTTSINTNVATPTATDTTFFFQIYPESTGAGNKYVFSSISLTGQQNYVSVADNTLIIHNDMAFLTGISDGIWTVPISANTHYLVAIKFQWGNTTVNPVVFLNGVSQTVTETSTPNNTISWLNAILNIGADNGDLGDFDGKISEFAWWNSQLTDPQCTQLTLAKVKGLPLQISPSTLQNYWPMDEVAEGVTITNSTLRDYKGTNNLTADSGIGAAETFISYPQ